MKRALCIWFPTLASDLARLRSGGTGVQSRDDARRTRRTDGDRRATQQAFIISATRGPRRIVACRCEGAGRLGVRVGMPLAEATSLAPAALVRPLNTERNLAALLKLALRAQRFSPTTAIDPPDGLWLDIHGCQHLFKGEPGLLRAVRAYFLRLGLRTRCAIAPTFACARAAAQYGEKADAIIPAGGERAAIEPLPIAALAIDPAVRDGLLEVGIERIADVLCVPRAALPARFGEEALRAADRMLGHAPELIRPIHASPPREAAAMFDGPTTQWEALSLACRAVLSDLCAGLLAAEAGALRIDVTLPRSDCPPLRLTCVMGRPTRDAARLWSLLRPRLERANLGFGIEGVRILAHTACGLPHSQRTLRADDPTRHDTLRRDSEELAALIDALSNRLGLDRIRRAVLTESHRPERAFEFVPGDGGHREQTRRAARPHGPTLVLDPPLPARVALDAGGLPVCVDVHTSHSAVAHAAGPHRIAPEWWLPNPGAPRDYFTVSLTDGRCLWLRHDMDTGRWWVQGAWA